MGDVSGALYSVENVGPRLRATGGGGGGGGDVEPGGR